MFGWLLNLSNAFKVGCLDKYVEGYPQNNILEFSNF